MIRPAFALCLAGILGCHAHSGHAHGAHAHGPHAHRFDDPAHWAAVFDNPARDAWQEPDRVLARMNLRPSARVADLGAGTGYFSVRLARAVPQGRVWALDLEPNLVRYLHDRARRENLGNLQRALRGRPASSAWAAS